MALHGRLYFVGAVVLAVADAAGSGPQLGLRPAMPAPPMSGPHMPGPPLAPVPGPPMPGPPLASAPGMAPGPFPGPQPQGMPSGPYDAYDRQVMLLVHAPAAAAAATAVITRHAHLLLHPTPQCPTNAASADLLHTYPHKIMAYACIVPPLSSQSITLATQQSPLQRLDTAQYCYTQFATRYCCCCCCCC
jgi:hypothetical protein